MIATTIKNEYPIFGKIIHTLLYIVAVLRLTRFVLPWQQITTNYISVISSTCTTVDNINLCARHMPHHHMLKNVFDRRTLEKVVASKVGKQLTHRGAAPLVR